MNNSSPTSFSFFLFFFVFFSNSSYVTSLNIYSAWRRISFLRRAPCKFGIRESRERDRDGMNFSVFFFFFFANNNEMYFGMERKKQKRKNATPILRPGSEVSSGRTGGMHFNRKPERYALHITFCSLVFVLFFSFPSLFLSFFFFCCIRCYAISFRKKH